MNQRRGSNPSALAPGLWGTGIVGQTTINAAGSLGNYIVRVDPARPVRSRQGGVFMEDVVESVESRECAAFHNATELWAILAGVCRRSPITESSQRC